MEESEDILKLGLLFGEDTEATSEEMPEVLSFQHKLLQEMVAAYYIADQAKTNVSFLNDAFPSWGRVETHKEVVQFTCGLLARSEIGARAITDHVAHTLGAGITALINDGRVKIFQVEPSNIWTARIDFALWKLLQEEGRVTHVSPYFSEYPDCGNPLAEVLSNTGLALITGVDSKDSLKVESSTAYVILSLAETGKGEFSRLWKALKSAKTNIVALHLFECEIDENTMDELGKYIADRGSEMPLKIIHLDMIPIPNSLLASLGKCTRLVHIDMAWCNLSNRVHLLVDNPSPVLKCLSLTNAHLLSDDVDQIADSVRQNKLGKLEQLDIQYNPICSMAEAELFDKLSKRCSEPAVGGLLEAFLTICGQKQSYATGAESIAPGSAGENSKAGSSKDDDQESVGAYNECETNEIKIWVSSACEIAESKHTVSTFIPELGIDVIDVGQRENQVKNHHNLSKEFVQEWSLKLKETNIHVLWSNELDQVFACSGDPANWARHPDTPTLNTPE